LSSLISELKNRLGTLDFEVADKFYEGEWVNLTPFMPGDYKGRTWRYDPGQRLIFSEPNLAQAIKARMRYVSLLALASFVKDPRSYPDVLQKTFKFFKVKIKKGKSTIEEHLFNVLFGNTKVASIFDVGVELRGTPKPWNVNVDSQAKMVDRYHALLMRSGKNARATPEELKPIEPGTLFLKVSLFWKDHARVWLARDELTELETLLKTTLSVTMEVFGIGKATSRGFGRFYPRYDTESGINTKTISPSEQIGLLLKLWINISKKLGDSNELKEFRNLKLVPSLSTAVAWLECCDLSLMRLASVNDPDEAITKIALATLKGYWKTIRGKKLQEQGLVSHAKAKKIARESGTYYHTWTLGLPRKAKLSCTCFESNPKGMIKGGKKSKARENYGYLIVKEQLEENVCVKSHYCNGRKVRTSEGRRQSMFILFPYKDGQGLALAVLPLVSLDMWEYLVKGNKKGSGGGVLYHVGGHFVKVEQHKQNKKSMPCCNRHFVSIKKILTEDYEIESPTELVPNHHDYHENAKLCRCGKDPAGIARPPSASQLCENLKSPRTFKDLNDQIYELVLKNTICWLAEALNFEDKGGEHS